MTRSEKDKQSETRQANLKRLGQLKKAREILNIAFIARVLKMRRDTLHRRLERDAPGISEAEQQLIDAALKDAGLQFIRPQRRVFLGHLIEDHAREKLFEEAHRKAFKEGLREMAYIERHLTDWCLCCREDVKETAPANFARVVKQSK